MEAKEIIQAIKDTAWESTIDWAKRTPCTDDEKFCEANGTPTFSIAKKLGVDNKTARRELDKLHKKGLIYKSKNNAGSFCRWWPVGFLAELKATK